jgi:hypothetical protein
MVLKTTYAAETSGPYKEMGGRALTERFDHKDHLSAKSRRAIGREKTRDLSHFRGLNIHQIVGRQNMALLRDFFYVGLHCFRDTPTQDKMYLGLGADVDQLIVTWQHFSPTGISINNCGGRSDGYQMFTRDRERSFFLSLCHGAGSSAAKLCNGPSPSSVEIARHGGFVHGTKDLFSDWILCASRYAK